MTVPMMSRQWEDIIARDLCLDYMLWQQQFSITEMQEEKDAPSKFISQIN